MGHEKTKGENEMWEKDSRTRILLGQTPLTAFSGWKVPIGRILFQYLTPYRLKYLSRSSAIIIIWLLDM